MCTAWCQGISKKENLGDNINEINKDFWRLTDKGVQAAGVWEDKNTMFVCVNTMADDLNIARAVKLWRCLPGGKD